MQFYEIGIDITYRKVVRLKKEHGLYVDIPNGIFVNMGYLMPGCMYMEFPICDTDILQESTAIDRICFLMKEYAIPFMEKYSDPKHLILSHERNEFVYIHVNKQLLVLLYYLYEGKAKSLTYVSEQIRSLREVYEKKQPRIVEHHKGINTASMTLIVHGDELKNFEDLRRFIMDSVK